MLRKMNVCELIRVCPEKAVCGSYASAAFLFPTVFFENLSKTYGFWLALSCAMQNAWSETPSLRCRPINFAMTYQYVLEVLRKFPCQALGQVDAAMLTTSTANRDGHVNPGVGFELG